MLISTMARDFRITDAGRAEVNEKLAVFQMRLDEAANLIEGLDSADAERWATRHDAVREAMRRVEDAREDAWDALEDAPMTDPTAAGA